MAKNKKNKTRLEYYKTARCCLNKGQKKKDNPRSPGSDCLCKEKCIDGYKGPRKNHSKTYEDCDCVDYNDYNGDEICKKHIEKMLVINDCLFKFDQNKNQPCWGDCIFLKEECDGEDPMISWHVCQGHKNMEDSTCIENYIPYPNNK